MHSWTWNVTSPPPVILSSAPNSPVNDIAGASKLFNITIDKPTDVSWYINGTPIQFNGSVTQARYTNNSAAVGTWNVSAIATNAYGSVMHSWIWNVTPPSQVILSSAPYSPVNDIAGASRIFNITIDQPTDVSWYINGTLIQSNGSVTQARYTNNSAAVGTWNVSAIATNSNGSVMHSWTWKVINNFGGFFQPIDTDGSSVFKLGSIVPIKFQLIDANGNYVTGAVARLNFTKIYSSITGSYLETSTTETETTGDVFIYSNKSHMYKYNLTTKKMSSGTWKLSIDIDGGSSNTVNISLEN